MASLPAAAAVTADRANTPGAARPAVADQAGVAAGAAGLVGPTGGAITAVAVQQPAGPAGLPRCRSVGAVTN
ncbi:Uncharacterised protein [Mycobacterium tuberculosis]|nr:Uncharacterised protein [Mycobacterium tuberculosis]